MTNTGENQNSKTDRQLLDWPCHLAVRHMQTRSVGVIGSRTKELGGWVGGWGGWWWVVVVAVVVMVLVAAVVPVVDGGGGDGGSGADRLWRWWWWLVVVGIGGW